MNVYNPRGFTFSTENTHVFERQKGVTSLNFVEGPDLRLGVGVGPRVFAMFPPPPPPITFIVHNQNPMGVHCVNGVGGGAYIYMCVCVCV